MTDIRIFKDIICTVLWRILIGLKKGRVGSSLPWAAALPLFWDTLLWSSFLLPSLSSTASTSEKHAQLGEDPVTDLAIERYSTSLL